MSGDFLASDFIDEDELPPLLVAAETEGLIIMPVILKPCRFSKTKTLSQFQSVNDPKEPLLTMSEGERETFWVELTKKIEQAIASQPAPQESSQTSKPSARAKQPTAKALLGIDWPKLKKEGADYTKLIEIAMAIAGDDDVGSLVTIAVDRVWRSDNQPLWIEAPKFVTWGPIVVRNGHKTECDVESYNGMLLDHGYSSPYFLRNPTETEIVLKSPLILLCNRSFKSGDAQALELNGFWGRDESLLLIADSIDDDALEKLIEMKERRLLVASGSMGFGDRKREIFNDIGILVGATVVRNDMSIAGLGREDLGRAEHTIVDQDTTQILGGHSSTEELAGRIAQLDSAIEETTSDYDREKLWERRCRLKAGGAILRSGGRTVAEIPKNKLRLEHTLIAIKRWIDFDTPPTAFMIGNE